MQRAPKQLALTTMLLQSKSRRTLALPKESGSSPKRLGKWELVKADAFVWLHDAKPRSIQAVVTDPPYGLVEYQPLELAKMKKGRGGVWRIPPAFDGCQRSPLPRFTVLTEKDRGDLRAFFKRFAEILFPVLVPGAHTFIGDKPPRVLLRVRADDCGRI